MDQYKRCFLITALLAGLAAADTITLIRNGSFETDSDWTFVDPDQNSETVRWTGSGAGLGTEAHTGVWYAWGGEVNRAPTDHSYSGLVTQVDIPTVAGRAYVLSFWLCSVPSTPVENSLGVFWAPMSADFPDSPTSQDVQDEISTFGFQPQVASLVDISGTPDSPSDPDHGYRLYQYAVTGTGMDKLMFEMYDPPTALLLDDVSLFPTPEPGTFGMAVAAAGAIAAWGVARRRLGRGR